MVSVQFIFHTLVFQISKWQEQKCFMNRLHKRLQDLFYNAWSFCKLNFAHFLDFCWHMINSKESASTLSGKRWRCLLFHSWICGHQDEGLPSSSEMQQDWRCGLWHKQDHLQDDQDVLQHKPMQRSARHPHADPGPRHHLCCVCGKPPGLTEDATSLKCKHGCNTHQRFDKMSLNM